MMVSASRRSFIGGVAGSAALASAGRAQAVGVLPPQFGPDSGAAWLVANENPYGPAPSALQAIAATAGQGSYYSQKGVERLAAMIAERHSLSPKQVVIGTGSGELLNAIALAWGRKGTIVCPSLFFGGSVTYAESFGAKAVRVPLAADMHMDLAGLAAATDERTSLVHICNPNNPTGMTLSGAQLRAFAAEVTPKATLFVDEAYNELTSNPAGTSLVDLVRQGQDVIITRTFSKLYGMAGLRVGYALTSEANAAVIRRALMNGTGNTAGLAAAIASYDDTSFIAHSLSKIGEARETIEAAVRAAGLAALPSETNFVFVKVPDAESMRAAMAERNIVIRGAYGAWKQYSRVSCGKIEDVARYCAALPQVIEGLRA